MSFETIRSAQEERIQLFEKEVEAAQWKKDHQQAMRCLTFEDMLRFGIAIFEGLMDLDASLRPGILKGEIDERYDKLIHDLLVGWLRPCDAVERDLRGFLDQGFEVENAAKFRKCHQEAKWILKPAKEAFNHKKMVAARDEAIDALRREDVLTE